MIHVRVLGSLDIVREDGTALGSILAQPKRTALLVYLLLAPSRGGLLRRDELIATFWPESDAERARGALSQALSFLRRSLGPDVVRVRGTEDVGIEGDHVRCDALGFADAAEAGDWKTASALYDGPLLQGFHLPDSVPFDHWLEGERLLLARLFRRALEEMALAAEATDDHRAAVRWWRRLGAEEPMSSRVALRLMRALAASGDAPAAIRHAERHAAVLEEELGCAPDPEVLELAARLRGDGEQLEGTSLARPHAPSVPLVPDLLEAAASPSVPGSYEPATTGSAEAGSRSPPSRRSALTAGGWIPYAAIAGLAGLFLLGWIGRTGTAQAPVESGPAENADALPKVEVHPFEFPPGDSALEGLAEIASEWVLQGLAETRLVDAFGAGAAAWRTGGGSMGNASLVADQAGGLHFGVSGRLQGAGDSVYLRVAVSDAHGSRIGSFSRAAATEDPMPALESVRQQVMALLAIHGDENLRAWATEAGQPTSFEAYRAFSVGMEAFSRLNYDAALEHYYRAVAHDSAYALPLVWAVFAHRNAAGWPSNPDSAEKVAHERARDSLTLALAARRDRLGPLEAALSDYHLATMREDSEGRYHATRRLVQIAPRSEWRYLHALNAKRVRRPYEALAALLELNPERGWLRDQFGVNYWTLLSRTLYHLEEPGPSLTVLREARERYASGHYVEMEGMLLVMLGRWAEFDALLDYLSDTDRTHPGFFSVLRNLAGGLWTSGRDSLSREVATGAARVYGAANDDVQRRSQYRLPAMLILAGRPDSARGAIAAFVPEDCFRPDACWTDIAVASAMVGDRAAALHEEARSAARGDHLSRVRIWAALGEPMRAMIALQDHVAQGNGPIQSDVLSWAPEYRSLFDHRAFLYTFARPLDSDDMKERALELLRASPWGDPAGPPGPIRYGRGSSDE